MLNLESRNVLWRAGFFIFAVILFSAFIFSSCATPKQSEEDYQLALIEKQVNETDKKIDEIYHRVSVLQLTVDNHERSIRDLEKQFAVQQMENSSPAGPEAVEEKIQSEDLKAEASPAQIEAVMPEPEPQPPPDMSGSPQMLYNKALLEYRSADYEKAASMFSRFSEKYASHDLSVNALYWKGECEYAQKKFSEAIVIFKALIDKYPDGSKAPDAMLKIGYAYLSMDDRENARLFLKKVVENFPFSSSGTKAEMMLKKIR